MHLCLRVPIPTASHRSHFGIRCSPYREGGCKVRYPPSERLLARLEMNLARRGDSMENWRDIRVVRDLRMFQLQS